MQVPSSRFMIVIDLETLKQVSRHPAADSKANLHESSIKELGCPDCFHHFRLHFLASVVIQLLKYLYLIVSHSVTSRTSLILRKNSLSAELAGNGWWASVCLMSWIQSYLVLAVLCHFMSLVNEKFQKEVRPQTLCGVRENLQPRKLPPVLGQTLTSTTPF